MRVTVAAVSPLLLVVAGCDDLVPPPVHTLGPPVAVQLVTTDLADGVRIGPSARGGVRTVTVVADFKASCRMGPAPVAEVSTVSPPDMLELAVTGDGAAPCIEGERPLRYTATLTDVPSGRYTVRVVHRHDRFRGAIATVLEARDVSVTTAP